MYARLINIANRVFAWKPRNAIIPSMTWQHYLRVKSRDPAYLWRMVLAILAVGVLVGWAVEMWQGGAPEFVAGPHDSSGWERLDSLASEGNWWLVWWQVPQQIFSDFSQLGIIVLAVLAGCCWLAFLLQSMRVQRFTDWRLWGALAAIALGVLSIWPTGFFILWQEHGWNLQESQELVPGLRYNILGIGLREEFAKLLCLLPLMLVVVPRRDELAALILSGCVGLGFAIEENIGYFTVSQGTSSLGRFLTANPMHITLTGLVGLAVYRAFRDVRNWGPNALAVFGLAVAAHGLYDATIVLTDLAQYNLAGTIVFALIVYAFFHELRTLRPKGSDTITLSATFLCGMSLLAAATFVYVSSVAGVAAAANTLMSDVMGLAVMVYLFLREMPETMVRV